MKKILLLGAGYANMSLLTRLDSASLKKAQWTLVTKEPYHYKSITLHDVASGKIDKRALFDLENIKERGVCVVCDEITSIEANIARGKNANYEYDYLSVGLGFDSDDFGIKGVKQYAKAITSYKSAQRLRCAIEAKLAQCKDSSDDISFVVCGGGFSGIEFVSSLAEELQKKCTEYNINFARIKIACIEAMPNILPMFNAKLQNLAVKKLEALGVAVMSGSKILECKESAIVIEQGGEKRELGADIIIWTAGVRGNSVIENSHIFNSTRSKVEVDRFLHPLQLNAQNLGGDSQNLANMAQNLAQNIFIMGDCAAFKDEKSGRFFPPTAQIAREQGKYLAKVFKILLNNPQGKIPPFIFTPKGSICSLGESYALGNLGIFEIKGKSASALKKIVESLWDLQLKGIAL